MTTKVTIKASESSSAPWIPKMIPLCHLPSERPLYNASRPVFSRWERDSKNKPTGNMSSDEKAFKDFEDSSKMICGLDGPISEMRCDTRFRVSFLRNNRNYKSLYTLLRFRNVKSYF